MRESTAESVGWKVLAEMIRQEIMDSQTEHRNVITWCRVCGCEAILQVPADYEWALSEFHALDDQPRVHYGHVETTNWGVHWRLDEVLFMLFPRQHRTEEWPMTKWWLTEYGEPESQHRPVEWLSEQQLKARHPSQQEMDRQMLIARVDRDKRTKAELLQNYIRVWNQEDLRKEFDTITFQKPFVIARSKRTSEVGTLLYQETPRLYFGWSPSF